jgi:His-Xaa-Ser system protein HxsD
MSEVVPSLPPELAAIELADASVALSIDASTYGLEALYASSYAFLDRAYVLLDRPSPERYRVTLAPKRSEGEVRAQLTQLAGEFANELLAAAYRQRLHADNRALVESVTMRAVAGALGPPAGSPGGGETAPSLEELEAFDFSAEAFEDPLGIAMSWEEKYGKKTPPKAGDDPPAPQPETKKKDAG